MNRHLAHAGGGQRRQMPRSQDGAGGGHRLPGGHIFTMSADVAPRGDIAQDADRAVVPELDQLLFHHRIGVLGQRRSGGDIDRFGARPKRQRSLPGRGRAGELQDGALAGDRRRPEREAIHGGVVEAGDVESGDGIGRQHGAESVFELNVDGGQRPAVRHHHSQRGVQRDRRRTVTGAAVRFASLQ